LYFREISTEKSAEKEVKQTSFNKTWAADENEIQYTGGQDQRYFENRSSGYQNARGSYGRRGRGG
jgi:hypothetical protein